MAGLVEILLVAIGGATGATLRVLLTIAAATCLRVPFWIGIMVVNIVGCLLIGIAAAILASADASEMPLIRLIETVFPTESEGVTDAKLILLTGLLGGFTTFSTAMLDTWVLWRSGHVVKSMISLVGTPIAAITALAMGLAWGGGA
ncbi:MAG: hypothetical protein GY921_01410 [Phycisphaeraceae bacterium]|nr:hypothetical protein [Phycisphaeraceae bacterium]MCP4937815.1 hypothetical protein [Phycisphaeraceae bacterium]